MIIVCYDVKVDWFDFEHYKTTQKLMHGCYMQVMKVKGIQDCKDYIFKKGEKKI